MNNAAAALTLEGDGNLPSKLMRARWKHLLHQCSRRIDCTGRRTRIITNWPFCPCRIGIFQRRCRPNVYRGSAFSHGRIWRYAFRIAISIIGLFIDGYNRLVYTRPAAADAATVRMQATDRLGQKATATIQIDQVVDPFILPQTGSSKTPRALVQPAADLRRRSDCDCCFPKERFL